VTPSTNATVGNEAVAVGVPVPGGNVVFASYNSSFGVELGDGKKTHCGWSKSNTSQTSFVSRDSFYNPSLLNVPVMTSGMPYGRCRGDTWAAAMGPQRLSQVLMVAVAEDSAGVRDAVLWSSIDGGTSFPFSKTVSDTTSFGNVDGTKVAVDTKNNTAYVWWKNGDGQMINDHYMRKVTIAASGAITLGAIKKLTNKVTGAAAPWHATISIKHAASTTAFPRIFLAYPTAGMGGNLSCFTTYTDTINVNWYLAYSDDDGTSWTSLLVDNDPTFPRCQFQSPSSDPYLALLGGNRSYISSTFDTKSGRVLLAYQRHEDDENGSYVGTRIRVKHWPSEDGGTGANFDTWVPVCNPAVCPQGGGNCLVEGRLPAGETYCTQYGQSVGVRTVGSVSQNAVVWHDTRDTPLSNPHPSVGDAVSRNKVKSDVWGLSVRPGEPKDGCNPNCPNSMSALTGLGSGVPWLPTGANGNIWWGDYEQGVADVGGKFFSVWADNRDQATTTRLKGAQFDYGP